jgi:hypothetical protein
MLDDREDTPGDLVHDGNIEQWKQKFCEDTGHTMECVDETVNDMAQLMSKVCDAFGGIPVEEIIEQMGVEQFDKHLRAILAFKECECLKQN